MGRKVGELRPGSLSYRLLHNLRHANAPLSRAALSRLFPKENADIGRTLTRLKHAALVRVDENGRWSDVRNATPKPQRAEPQPVPVPLAGVGLIAQVAAIVDRAHAYRRAGAPCMSVSLLERAARKIEIPHMRADLLALASLFDAHRELYPQVDFRRAAA